LTSAHSSDWPLRQQRWASVPLNARPIDCPGRVVNRARTASLLVVSSSSTIEPRWAFTVVTASRTLSRNSSSSEEI
jgi:hypothetical protein